MSESTETTEAPATHLSRRTLVRGAAWSVPVVSVVAAAPAFAASIQPPNFGLLMSGKLPGKSTDVDFGYQFTVPFTGDASMITNIVLVLNDQQYPVSCLMTNGSVLAFQVRGTNSADGAGTGVINYEFNGQPMTATFDYDGTKPFKGYEQYMCTN